MSPECRIPPSAITGTSAGSAASRALSTAETCGTPTPVTIRVVQMDPGPMPTLTASTPASMSSCAPSVVATLPAMTSMSNRLLIAPDGVDDVAAVAVGGVDDQHVHLGVDERLGPVELTHAHRGADAQAAAVVPAGEGELVQLGDVAHGDQARQPALVVHEGSFSTLFSLRICSACSSVVPGRR